MKPCRECGHEVSERAVACPNCGAPRPALERFDGYGFEYRSRASFLGLPLLHVSFKVRNRRPVPAVGVIAIGQFGLGVVTIAQFGIGWLCVCQFALAAYALAQFAVAWDLIAQMGLFLHAGYGQLVVGLPELLAKLNGG